MTVGGSAGVVTVDLDDHWRELVTVAMLGTDRRDPPAVPDGPVADLVADALRPDAASRMLAAVATVAAARRAGFVPGPIADPLRPPDPDDRPTCPAVAAATWRRIVADWAVLEDEWLLTLIERGWRLAADVLVDLLARHRGDAIRRARVMIAGGPTAVWLVDQLTELDSQTHRRADPDAIATLPELPVPAELAELLVGDAHTVSRRLAAGFDDGAFGPPDRAVLVNVVARCRPAVLLDVAQALERTQVGQALALADLARLRHQMLTELDARP